MLFTIAGGVIGLVGSFVYDFVRNRTKRRNTAGDAAVFVLEGFGIYVLMVLFASYGALSGFAVDCLTYLFGIHPLSHMTITFR